MSEPVIIPSARELRGSVDRGDDIEGELCSKQEVDTNAAVVACPPHPKHGGSRHDERLRAVSDAVTELGVDCLRFDYGPWGRGHKEIEDARNAIQWTSNQYKHVALFGYSFGGAIALLAAADSGCELQGISVLSPAAQLNNNLDAVTVLREIGAPLQVIYGNKDTTVNWEPVVKGAQDADEEVIKLPADHSFVGQRDQIAEITTQFFDNVLRR